MKRSRLLIASAVLALAACDGNSSTSVDSGSGNAEDRNSTGATTDHARGMTQTVDAAGPGNEPGSPGAGTSMEDADRKALLAVMEVDRHEIAAADDALAKNVQGDVRAYAETLRRDHTRNLDATQALLGASPGATGAAMTTVSGGTAATTADATHTGDHDAARAADGQDLVAMQRKHQAERDRLASLSGAAFQKAWIEAMEAGHAEALAMLDGELIPAARDPRVRTHLQTTRAAIAAHLETARGLQD